jgi:hypothetical protein
MSDLTDYGAYLVQHLAERADEAERNGRDAAVLRFVLANGRSYNRLAPAQPARMISNACFENSADFARRPGLIYVEGFALVAVPGLVGFEHAWCVDASGHIHEVTWDRPGLAYFGVPLAFEYVAQRMATASHPEHGLLRTDDGSLLSGVEQHWRA